MYAYLIEEFVRRNKMSIATKLLALNLNAKQFMKHHIAALFPCAMLDNLIKNAK